MTPWLSVVCPVHGGETYLGATLASAAAEPCAGIEFRLYDSGADGGAARAVAERFADRLDIVWTDRPDLKPWTAKTNLGVTEARAAHVVMLHQDDLWLPGHVAALRGAIERMGAGGAALSIAPSRFVSAEGRLLSAWGLPWKAGRHAGRELARTLLAQNSVAIPSPVIQREAWLAVGGLDDELWYTADWDLYLKLAQIGDVDVRASATTAFRIHGGSLTMSGRTDPSAFRRQLEIVLERHMPGLGPLPAGLEKRALASVAVNCALADASAGRLAGLPAAALAVAGLGPLAWGRFLAESRIVDRLWPRLRLFLAGGL